MLITTSEDPNADLVKRAKDITKEMNGKYINRKRFSLQRMMDHYNDDLIVVTTKSLKYYNGSIKQPLFFHPNMAKLRIKRLKQGDNDLMVDITNLKAGDCFLDCTLGLASDSIIASYIVGQSGKIIGFESEQIIATLVQDGLQRGCANDLEIDKAMKRIKVKNINHFDGLKNLPDKSFDVIYFDPMFRTSLHESNGIQAVKKTANYSAISIDIIKEAKRVAKRMIVLKERTYSHEFSRLGFKMIQRTSSFTYGIIEIGVGR